MLFAKNGDERDIKKPIQRGGWIGFLLLRSLAGLFVGETLVGVQADFGEFLGLVEEFLGALGEELEEGCETHLAFEEVLELGPVGFLAVEGERVLVRAFESGVVAIEVPVAAFDCELLFFLAETHAGLETVVDTRSVGDDE